MSGLIQRKQIAIGGAPFASNPSVPAGNTVSNVAVETAFASQVALPGNAFKAGDFISVRARGVYSAAVLLPSLRIRAYLGSTLCADTGALTALISGASNLGWSLDLDLLLMTTGMDVQSLARIQSSATNATVLTLANVAPIAFNSTTASALTLTATWSAAAAANSITLRQLVARVD